MNEILEIAITAAIVIGALFTLVGSFGLVKLNRPMSRLHAPTKAGTLGVGSLLAASMLYSFGRGDPSLHELLIMAFLFITAPVSAHFVAKVLIHHARNRQELPAPPADRVWATKDVPEQEEAPAR
jgi:multicomponent K+:H+ antiporter subunit G